jgi:simple sugar transport system permease protein
MVKNSKKTFETFWVSHVKNITLFVLMLFIMIFFSIYQPNRFPTVRNFRSMLAQFPEFGLLAQAMMLSMIVGGIDLSVVAVANLSGVLAALVLSRGVAAGTLSGNILVILAILLVLVVSTLSGAFNGSLIAFAGVPPILATLGTQGLLMGLAIVLTKGYGITGFPPEIDVIGNGFLFGIPVPFLIFAVTAIGIAVILKKTRLGFNMYMVGANPTVASFSGIHISTVLLRTYMLSGVLAGISSLIMISRTNSMRPGYGTDYLLQAILVAVLGGTDPKGGVGSLVGLLMAIMILQFTQSGLNLLAFSAFMKKFIWGLALLLIMVANLLIAKYNERKRVQAVRESTGKAKIEQS